MNQEHFSNGQLILNYGTKDEKVIGEISEAVLTKEIKTEIIITPCPDGFIINGYMVHEICEGEYAVYSPEQQTLEGEAAENIDYPVFKYVCNAIAYCLGFYNGFMLSCEPDFKEYIERNGKK